MNYECITTRIEGDKVAIVTLNLFNIKRTITNQKQIIQENLVHSAMRLQHDLMQLH